MLPFPIKKTFSSVFFCNFKNNVYLCGSNQNKLIMKKRILLSIFAIMALTTAAAQDVVSGFRFGYLSYEAALKAMPDYALVQQKMDQMRQQFQAETLRVEDEFNLKYSTDSATSRRRSCKSVRRSCRS